MDIECHVELVKCDAVGVTVERGWNVAGGDNVGDCA